MNNISWGVNREWKYSKTYLITGLLGAFMNWNKAAQRKRKLDFFFKLWLYQKTEFSKLNTKKRNGNISGIKTPEEKFKISIFHLLFLQLSLTHYKVLEET